MNLLKIRSALVMLAYVVFLNLPLWIASQEIGLHLKGAFNVEFAVLGILALFLPRVSMVPLVLAATLVDLLSDVSWTYSLSLSNILCSSGSMFEAASSRGWETIAIVSAIAISCFVAWVLINYARKEDRASVAIMLGVLTVACISIDIGTGQVTTFRPDRQLGFLRLTREPITTLRKIEQEKRRQADGSHSVAGASKVLASLQMPDISVEGRSQRPNVVLVLVESWGIAQAHDLEQGLLQPYRDPRIQEKYEVSEGTAPFYGATVDGEARELCASTSGFGVIHATTAQFKKCLPARLAALGYHTTAIHGFTGGMFERKDWYPRAGFEETWFREQLQSEGLPLCPGPFPGICDAAVPGWLGTRLRQDHDSPQFIYWVTLNSHLPIPIPNGVSNPAPCGSYTATANDATLCSWYQLIQNVHRSVSRLAMEPLARPTIFIIAGDHAPPFSQQGLRNQFSRSSVPYVVLTPKPELRREMRPTRLIAEGRAKPLHKAARGTLQFDGREHPFVALQ